MTKILFAATIFFTIDDAEGGTISITVDYGDGFVETATGPNGDYQADHTYGAAGTYTVIITAQDPQGLQVADITQVTIP